MNTTHYSTIEFNRCGLKLKSKFCSITYPQNKYKANTYLSQNGEQIIKHERLSKSKNKTYVISPGWI